MRTGARLRRVLQLRWRSLTRPAELDADLDRELAFHVDQLVREGVDQGLAPHAARAAARRAMGNMESARASARDQRRMTWFDDLWRDVQYAARQLRARPQFATIAAGSLSFALVANVAGLSALQTILRKPLPDSRADRLVILRAQSQVDGLEHDQTSFLEFQAWKTRARTLESASASFAGDRDMSGDAFGPALRMATSAVTAGWFDTLGVGAFRGRIFDSRDYQERRGPEVMLISYALWQSRYARDPHAIEHIARVGGVNTRIVGVLPPDFAYQSRRVQAWFPLRIDPERAPGPARAFSVIALRRAGTSLAQTQTDVEHVSQTIAGALPASLDWHPHAVSLSERERGWARRPLFAFELAAALVMLVACANVGSLLLSRNVARRHEFALRSALGATRGRLVRQILAESALLTCGAGAMALLTAEPALRVLTEILSPPLDAARLTLEVASPPIGIVVGLMFFATMAVGLAPAIVSARRYSMATASTGVARRSVSRLLRFQDIHVVIQIAAAVVLLVSATLVAQSFWRLTHRDLGFDQRRLLLFQIRIDTTDPRAELARVHDLLSHVSGVVSVGGVSDWWLSTLIVPKAEIRLGPDTLASTERAQSLIVTPGFFAALRAPVTRGREFNDTDNDSASWSIVVNEEAARLLWGSQDPIGKTLTLGAPEERVRLVIGVVKNMPLHREDVAPTPMIYTSSLQQPPYQRPAIGVGPAARMTFALRYSGAGSEVAREAQHQVGALGLSLPFVFMGGADDLGRLLVEFRNYSAALAALALVAMALTILGLYGIAAHSVTEGTKDIALRIAVGARRHHILRVVSVETAVATAVGLAVGWIGTLVLPRLIASKLWGVDPADPTATVVIVTVVAVALAAATWIPLRRALRVDPGITLRAE